MNMKRLSLAGGVVALGGLVGCADPCLDDGLLQEGNEVTCPSLAEGGGTDSEGMTSESDTEGETESESDSEGGTCDNGVMDGDETDVDCGGSCEDQCGGGMGCEGDEDCESGSCDPDDGTCEDDDDGSCNDEIENQDESDVDCGGECGPTCEDGEDCNDDDDCVSDNCEEDGTCQPPDDDDGTCEDGEENQDETDVDCGGSCGPTCEIDEGCLVGDDCVSDFCDEETDTCQPPDDDGTCEDDEENQDETDVDCGGTCGPTCEIDEGCLVDGDCVSDFCDDDTDTCQEPPGETCEDDEENQDETDVDCGGVCGPTCETGEDCLEDDDCISDDCGDDDTCQPDPLWCDDEDDDGFGDPDACVEVPEGEDPPAGTVNNDDDCDDESEFAFPGAAPNDSLTECMEDKDGDDWGDDDPTGAGTTPGTDCDDDSAGAAATFPGSAEFDDPDACMEDKDDDGWGDDDPTDPGTTPGDDCDDDSDAAAATFPGSAELDDPDACMEDEDDDGWGDDDPTDPGTTPGDDCDDDSDAAEDTFPGAAELDDPDACMEDKDDDGWGDDDPTDPGTTPGDDCDDDSDAGASTFPGAAPNDSPVACMEDEDGDDWGDDDPTDAGTTPGTDCDDDSAEGPVTFPGAAELDSDTACMKDEDDDGWGDDTPGPGVMPGSDCDEDGEPPCALLVTQDGTNDDTYDQGLTDILTAQGYVVTYVADTTAVLADANGFNVVVISETANSGDIGGTYQDVLVPTICLEGFVWDDMGMAPAGTDDPATFVDIIDDTTELDGGLDATYEVISGGGSGLFYTSPPAGALEIASVSGEPDQIVYFAFDQGDAMLGGFVAPRRRIGLGFDADQGAGAVTILDDGLTLFDAALTWVVQ